MASSSIFTPLQLRHRPPSPHFPANNGGGGDGGFWGNDPFDSDGFSSSSSGYTLFFTLLILFHYILFLQSPSNQIGYLTEPASTAASCSENNEEESSSLPPEITIGIDIGTWPCCISVWNGSKVELWKKKINEMKKRSCETSKDRSNMKSHSP
ncbi:unnamed protein product [Trifolium pratense]|uniref:Uncharacterized protein n=1 Tax=Trifolium pratense TaxID=57577 RepID=A0ACB0ME30_TRIPR|nr:unnamed protein product [Trifolium pratense]